MPAREIDSKLIPMMHPFAFRSKHLRSDGFNQHGVWEIVGREEIGTDRERLTIRRIATAKADCPLDEVFKVWLLSVADDMQAVTWETFLPTENGRI